MPGGADSLRAFPFNRGRPARYGRLADARRATSDPTGFPLGGNALLINNTNCGFRSRAKYPGRVLPRHGERLFEPGNISFRGSPEELQDFDYMVHDVGFGIRYRTPVGPVAWIWLTASTLRVTLDSPERRLRYSTAIPISRSISCPAIARALRRASAIFSSSFRLGKRFSMRGLVLMLQPNGVSFRSGGSGSDRRGSRHTRDQVKRLDRDIRLTDFLNRAPLNLRCQAQSGKLPRD